MGRIHVALLVLAASRSVAGDDRPPEPIRTIALEEMADRVRHCFWTALTPGGKHVCVHSQQKNSWDSPTPDLRVHDAHTGGLVVSKPLGLRSDRTPRDGTCALSLWGNRILYHSDGRLQSLDLPRAANPRSGSDPLKGTVIAPWSAIGLDAAGEKVFALNPGDTRHVVTVTDLGDGKQTRIEFKARKGYAKAATSNAVSGWFAVGGTDANNAKRHTVEFWPVEDGATRGTIECQAPVSSLAVSPVQGLLAVGRADGKVLVHDLKADKNVHTIGPVCLMTPWHLAFHPSGKYLAVGTTDSRGTSNLILIDTRAGKVLRSFSADAWAVAGLCFDVTGTRLATFGRNSIKIWDANALLGLEQQ